MVNLRLLIMSLFLVSAISSLAGAQAEIQCNPIENVEICIKEVNVSDTTVYPGERTKITLTARNVGNETGDAVVLLGIHQPEGGYDYYKIEEIHNLKPGEAQMLTIPLPWGEPAGVHELNFMLFDQSQQHLYDATGYYQKVVVEKKPFDLVGWFVGLGTVAQAALAIIALLIFVLTGRFVW